MGMEQGNFEKKYYYNGMQFETEAEMLEFIDFCKNFAGDCQMWEETFNRDCPYDGSDCPKNTRG